MKQLHSFIQAHQSTLEGLPSQFKRFLYERIDWNERVIAVLGPRGVGKTTLLLQKYQERFGSVSRCLYVTCDHIHLGNYGLFNLANDYFTNGGEALILDEIHKYPRWSQELKNTIDHFKTKKILLSGSSAVQFIKGIGDLSRRIASYHLPVMSFREFLNVEYGTAFEPVALKDILLRHDQISEHIRSKLSPQQNINICFKNYLRYGCYPFYREGIASFPRKLAQVVEKVIAEDIPGAHNLSQSKIPILRKMLWLIASSPPFTPNIEGMARDLGQSKEYTYRYLEYLQSAGLIQFLRASSQGSKSVRKPEKIFIADTNLLFAITGTADLESSEGSARESFFVNQLKISNQITTSKQGDFKVGSHTFEIGGPGKTAAQIRELKDSYLVLDQVPQGYGNRIPLYLFGFLY